MPRGGRRATAPPPKVAMSSIRSALRSTRIAVTIAALAACARATTWVVDDDGGPGVDFTDLPAAVLAAQGGDVLLVRPGIYSGFTLDEPLAILGEAGAVVAGRAVVRDVGSYRAVLASLSIGGLDVTDCAAPVLLDGLTVQGPQPTSRISGSADVRIRHATIGVGGYSANGLEIASSRVEIVQSLVRGANGKSDPGPFIDGGDGGDGILSTASELHLSATTVRAGHGGDATTGYVPMMHGGDGGTGVHVTGGELLVTGTSADGIFGGDNGTGEFCSLDGTAGPGIEVAGGTVARVSGELVQGGAIACGGNASPYSGTIELPPIADPSLSLDASVPPGGQVVFHLRGQPGASARLRLGRTASVVDVVGVFEDQLTVPLRVIDLGPIPASGLVDHPFTIPANAPPGFLLVAQGSVVGGDGTRLSQSVPMPVR